MPGASPTACAVLLATLVRAQPLGRGELLSLCRARSLRAGALSYEPALREVLDAGLIQSDGHVLRLSETGQRLAHLTNEFDEPTVAFEQLWGGIRFARVQLTRDLELEMSGTVVSGSVATLETAFELEQLGLVTLSDGRAIPTSQLAFALVAGTGPSQPDRDAIGDLAERMSVQFLEATGQPGATVLRLSEVSDRFGYDVLVIPRDGHASAFECKGTTGSWPLHLFLTRHEMRTAERLRREYNLLVWGDLRLSEDFHHQYERLIAAGYPVVLCDPATVFRDCWSLPSPCSQIEPMSASLSVAAIELELRAR
jgi:hypothetical protein